MTFSVMCSAKMGRLNTLVVLLILIAVFHVHGAKKKSFPAYISLCKRDDPQIKQCVLDNLERIKPHLAEGIPEMKIPGVDPLHISEVSLISPSFNFTYRDMMITGASVFEVKDSEWDIEDNHVKLSMLFPKLRIQDTYDLNGKLMFIELKGSGKADSNITDILGVTELRGYRIARNGGTYLEFNQTSMDLQIGGARTWMYDLFKGNEELTTSTNNIINDNIQEFYKEIKPLVNDIVGSFIIKRLQKVFSTFSLEELFPL